MDYLAAIFLGIIEGLTEFIPVSSTAHLLLFSRLISFSSANNFFEIGIQFGAIVALLLHFRQKFWLLVKQIFIDLKSGENSKTRSQKMPNFLNLNFSAKFLAKLKIVNFLLKSDGGRMILNLFLAFFPAAMIGFFAHNFIKEKLFGNFTIAISLLIGGVLMILVERKNLQLPLAKSPKIKNLQNVEKIPGYLAFLIGCFQCLAMVPGVSRSGATIIGAIACGLNRRLATEFSFLLAIPTLGAAALFDFYKNFSLLSFYDLKLLAVGLVASFFSSLLVIKFLLNYVARHDFAVFAYYRIILGSLIILIFL